MTKKMPGAGARRCIPPYLVAVFDDVVPTALCLLDADGRYVEVNASYCTLYGYAREELHGQSVDLVALPEEAEAVRACVARVQREALAPNPILEGRRRRKDGAEIWIEAQAAGVVGTAGQPLALFAVADISGRKADEAALAARTAQLEALREVGAELTRELDLPAVLRLITRRACELTGATAADLDLWDEARQLLLPTASLGHAADRPSTPRRLGEGAMGTVARTRRGLLLNEYRESGLAHPDTLAATRITASLLEPLLCDDRLLGVLGVDHETAGRTFSERDQALLRLFADQAAIAIENARLHEATRCELVDRRQAMAELETRVRQRTAEVADLYDHAPCGYHSLDADGLIVRINDTELGWLGYSQEEVLGKLRFPDLMTPSSRELFARAYPEIVAGRWSGDIELDVVRKDGSVFTAILRTTTVPDDAGNSVRSRASLFDITARKQAEQAVREREARLQTFLDSASDLVLRLAPTGRILYANRAATLRLASPGTDLVGQPLPAFVGPDHVAACRSALDQAADTGRPVPVEWTLRLAGGTILHVEGSLIPQVGEGRVLGVDGLFHDVTARREAEAALRRTNAELRRAAQTKDAFLATMSHELRTPMNAVLGIAEALGEEAYGPLTEKQQGALRHIEESGRHLLSLINDILDLSKIEAGKLTLEPDTVEVGGLCQASLRLIREAALKKQLEVGLALDPAVPLLVADMRRLKQILVNLLTNAVKFTPPGGRVGLEVTGDPDRQAVRFTVWDTGIGISEAEAATLFQPFVQLDSSLARQQQGTGLGLSLVSRLARLHGGGVDLVSTPGRGSRFTVRLPWLVPTAPAAAEPPAPAPPLECASAPVVEAVAPHAEQLLRHLQELGAQATVAALGGGVVEQAGASRPDIILLDLGLPDVPGWTVLRDLKADARTQAIPVVVATVPEVCAQALAAGAAAYLEKPVARAQLQATIRRAVGTHAKPRILVAAPSPTAPPPLLLLAEDNPQNATAVVEYLQTRNYRIAVANNGLQALDLARRQRPDLILMDVQMPEMDGLEAIRRLRAHPDQALAQVPIVAITALAMRGDRERCLQAGATAYLAKPVRLKELDQTIAGLLKPAAA
jgi:PAS domain S-box-containing protein